MMMIYLIFQIILVKKLKEKKREIMKKKNIMKKIWMDKFKIVMKGIHKWMRKNKMREISKCKKIIQRIKIQIKFKKNNKKIKKMNNLMMINKFKNNNKNKVKAKWINNSLGIIKIEYYKDFKNILMIKIIKNKVSQT